MRLRLRNPKLLILFLTNALLYVFSPDAIANEKIKIQLLGKAMASNTKISASSLTNANFSGFGVGAGITTNVVFNKFSAGMLFGVDLVNLSNSSNTRTQSETLSGARIFVGPRFTLMNFFIGFGALINKLNIESVSGAVVSTEKYSGAGVRVDVGITITKFLGFTVSPLFTYSSAKIRPINLPGENSMEDYSLAVEIGLPF